jgi:hypothetical protein
MRAAAREIDTRLTGIPSVDKQATAERVIGKGASLLSVSRSAARTHPRKNAQAHQQFLRVVEPDQ